MVDQNQYGMKCTEFDARLADALDGIMSGKELAAFKAHAAECGDCGPLFTQAESGMKLLKSLAEVEAPANLVHNILARTSMADPRMSHAPALAAGVRGSWLGRAMEWASPVIRPALNIMSQPRLAMTAAMAFFSVSLLLNLAGVRMSDLKNLDLRPSAISTSASLQYHQTTAKVVKYYENIRFVYELESRMKELKKDSGTTGEENEKQKQPRQNDNTSKSPETNQNENYSLEQSEDVIALLQNNELQVPTDCQTMQDRRLS
jgi:hypothetical protein